MNTSTEIKRIAERREAQGEVHDLMDTKIHAIVTIYIKPMQGRIAELERQIADLQRSLSLGRHPRGE